MSPREKYGKRRQITFRIGEIAQERLAQTAELFHLKPSEYVKALLYKDLQIFNEPTDQRRRSRSHHGVSTWEADEKEEGE
jgi:hypothetical protein